ncbi:DUF5707 domain-containing protein [Streptomyces tailanensis]|uniref:DUF5707 domain-containing protein n=1 Tax=Streptomyces tailanensis TaxID=2569858 RepID=UPI00122E8364|nr:DUF5707 domain-containing protein [Streptomyces tailanensis]
MSKRIVVSSLAGVLALGGITAGGLAVASATTKTETTVENTSVRYVAPSGSGAGSLTFTADVSDDSGVKGSKVLVWPASSKLDPTEADLRHVDSAVCERTTDDTSRCTYSLKVTKQDAADMDKGTWYVSTLATAKDGGTAFAPRVATFDVAG